MFNHWTPQDCPIIPGYLDLLTRIAQKRHRDYFIYWLSTMKWHWNCWRSWIVMQIFLRWRRIKIAGKIKILKNLKLRWKISDKNHNQAQPLKTTELFRNSCSSINWAYIFVVTCSHNGVWETQWIVSRFDGSEYLNYLRTKWWKKFLKLY